MILKFSNGHNCNQKKCNNANTNVLPKITSIYFITTLRCNLKCKYCFVHQDAQDMTLQVAKDAVDFVIKNCKETNNQNPMFNFFGGEPLLRWDDLVVPTIQYIRDKLPKAQIGITTNGILINKEKLEFMKKYKVGMLFSMDGDKYTQDLNRPTPNGKSSFDILKEKIPMILEYYPGITFRSTTDKETIHKYLENHKFAVENGFKNVFNIINVFSEYSEEEKVELQKQIALLADYYMDLIREGKNVIFNPFCEFFGRIKLLNSSKSKNRYRDRNIDKIGFSKCGIGGTSFASVAPDGTLYPCQELVGNPEYKDEFSIGNIYDGENDKKRISIINKFHPRLVRPKNKKCNSCKLNTICNGACLINNLLKYGDMNTMPDILCIYYETMLEEAYRVIRIMAEEKNELFKEIFKNSKDNSWG